jgi:hypothetical protein
MAYKNTLANLIDNNINKFITELCDKYSLDKHEVMRLWNGEVIDKSNIVNDVSSLVKSTKVVETKTSNISALKSMKVSELKALCKTKGIKIGKKKKEELIDAINNFDTLGPQEKPKEVKKKKNIPKISDLFTTKTGPEIIIKKNKWGNYEHNETHLVFVNEVVVGVQKDNGDITGLNDEDIDKCNCYKFNYNLPDNLSKKLLDTENEELLDDSEDDLIELTEDEAESDDEVVEESDDEIIIDDDSDDSDDE